MSNHTIEGKLKVLEERFQSELRIRKETPFHIPSALGTSRPGSGRRPRPLFANRDIPAYRPRSPHAAETENRMREVHKSSGNLTVNNVQYRSNVDDLQHLGELGSGTCGHVVKMLHRPSGAVIAVKQMRRSGNSEETKRILMDLDVVLGSHDCPYIVRCLGCFVTDADVWICMELMASCFDKLLKRLGAPIPEAILGKVTVATVNALSYLKDMHGVIHRDVKPSNILLDERGNVKLCDFGISGRLVDSKAKTRSAGCAAYMAPERIDPPDPTRPDYDIRADVWSLGISLVELATGVFPYMNCQNDFEVLTKVISDDPPQLPEDSNFSPEFKSFVSQCLTKNYRQRPKYAKLLEHPFVVKSSRSKVSVADWYATLSGGHTIPAKTVTTTATHALSGSRESFDAPVTPQPVRNFVTSSQWTAEQVTPTPARAWWATAGPAHAGGSSSQPASLETDFAKHSPYPRRRTLDACASPPPPPARRVSAENRWRPSPANSGNTSPIVLQRFYHQSQQRRSRVDLHATPRHRSLSREHSNGRSPEPPPRTGRPHPMLGHEANGVDTEPPSLHERLHPHPPSPLLLNNRYASRLSEGRSQSLTRVEPRNGLRSDQPAPHPSRHRHDDQAQAIPPDPLSDPTTKELRIRGVTPRRVAGWLHSLAGLLKRRLSGYVKWHHVAGRRGAHAHATNSSQPAECGMSRDVELLPLKSALANREDNQQGPQNDYTLLSKRTPASKRLQTRSAAPTPAPMMVTLCGAPAPSRKREELTAMANLRKKVAPAMLRSDRRTSRHTNEPSGHEMEPLDNRPKLLQKVLRNKQVSMVVQWSEVRTAWQDSEFITECLCWHNVYRQRHGAPQLFMAPELCDYAQAWANHLAHTNRFFYRNDRDVGQNLYQRPVSAIQPDVTGQEVSSYWYAAVRQYRFFKDPNILHANVNAGHFTQMVWASTRFFGVGKARSRAGKIIVVANYSPPGNLSGQFEGNVLPPVPENMQDLPLPPLQER